MGGHQEEIIQMLLCGKGIAAESWLLYDSACCKHVVLYDPLICGLVP